MKDYIGYSYHNKVLVGYYLNLGKRSYIYTVDGILYALTLDNKYLEEMFQRCITTVIYSDMESYEIEEDVMFDESLQNYIGWLGLQPQRKYTKEFISQYLLKRSLFKEQTIYSYETFCTYMKNHVQDKVYESLIQCKENELLEVLNGKTSYPFLERENGYYRYVGRKKGKYYERQASSMKEELVRFLVVL